MYTVQLRIRIIPKIITFCSATTKEMAKEVAAANAIRTLEALFHQ